MLALEPPDEPELLLPELPELELPEFPLVAVVEPELPAT